VDEKCADPSIDFYVPAGLRSYVNFYSLVFTRTLCEQVSSNHWTPGCGACGYASKDVGNFTWTQGRCECLNDLLARFASDAKLRCELAGNESTNARGLESLEYRDGRLYHSRRYCQAYGYEYDAQTGFCLGAPIIERVAEWAIGKTATFAPKALRELIMDESSGSEPSKGDLTPRSLKVTDWLDTRGLLTIDRCFPMTHTVSRLALSLEANPELPLIQPTLADDMERVDGVFEQAISALDVSTTETPLLTSIATDIALGGLMTKSGKFLGLAARLMTSEGYVNAGAARALKIIPMSGSWRKLVLALVSRSQNSLATVARLTAISLRAASFAANIGLTVVQLAGTALDLWDPFMLDHYIDEAALDSLSHMARLEYLRRHDLYPHPNTAPIQLTVRSLVDRFESEVLALPGTDDRYSRYTDWCNTVFKSSFNEYLNALEIDGDGRNINLV
jgi:Baculoviridae p74 conserved region